MDSARNFLSNVDPFQRLSGPELDSFASLSRAFSYGKGEALFTEGEEAANIWILQSGRVEILKYASEGRPTAIEIINPRGIFGTLCRIGAHRYVYPCTAVAATKVTALGLPDKAFWMLLQKNPHFLMGICSLCSQRLNFMQESARRSHEFVDKRIAEILLRLSKSHGSILPFSKREIAELAATSVETAIRTLHRFETEQLISSVRGQITLRNPQGLSAIRT